MLLRLPATAHSGHGTHGLGSSISCRHPLAMPTLGTTRASGLTGSDMPAGLPHTISPLHAMKCNSCGEWHMSASVSLPSAASSIMPSISHRSSGDRINRTRGRNRGRSACPHIPAHNLTRRLAAGVIGPCRHGDHNGDWRRRTSCGRLLPSPAAAASAQGPVVSAASPLCLIRRVPPSFASDRAMPHRLTVPRTQTHNSGAAVIQISGLPLVVSS